MSVEEEVEATVALVGAAEAAIDEDAVEVENETEKEAEATTEIENEAGAMNGEEIEVVVTTGGDEVVVTKDRRNVKSTYLSQYRRKCFIPSNTSNTNFFMQE